MLLLSLVGVPSGQPIVASVSTGFLRCEDHPQVPHEEAALRQLCANPLYSCGSGEPYRSKQCGLEAGKVKAKTPISTGFLWFLWENSRISHIFSDFPPKLCGIPSSPRRQLRTVNYEL
jgi:hypothetical protein